MHRVILGLVLCLVAAAAHSGAADRRFLPVDEAEAWSGVGRLNANGGFCTAALIRPTILLTAAHCVIDRRTDQPIPASRMRFVAGSRDGYYTANRRIVSARVHPDWSGYAGRQVQVKGDIAIVRLESAITSVEGRAYRVGPAPEAGQDVSLLSYGRDREAALSIQAPCQVLERYAATASLNCDVTYGASGSPVFQDGRIVGVISAMSQAEGEKIALAVLVDGAIQALIEEEVAPRPAPATGQAVSRQGPSGLFRKPASGGARLPGGKRPPGG